MLAYTSPSEWRVKWEIYGAECHDAMRLKYGRLTVTLPASAFSTSCRESATVTTFALPTPKTCLAVMQLTKTMSKIQGIIRWAEALLFEKHFVFVCFFKVILAEGQRKRLIPLSSCWSCLDFLKDWKRGQMSFHAAKIFLQATLPNWHPCWQCFRKVFWSSHLNEW